MALSGIPQLLERAFKNLGPTLFKTDFSFITGESYIDQAGCNMPPFI